MWTFYEKNKQAIHDIVLLLAAVLGCCLFFRYLFRIFLPFLIGWLLSLLFNPLADRLQKFHIPRGISAIIGILLLFALLGLLGFWSGTGLIAKLKELSENLPHYISLFETGLAHFWTRFDILAQRLPKTLQVFFSSLQTDSSGLSALPCSQGQRNRQAWRCFRLFHCVFCITDFRLFLHKGQRPASPAV